MFSQNNLPLKHGGGGWDKILEKAGTRGKKLKIMRELKINQSIEIKFKFRSVQGKNGSNVIIIESSYMIMEKYEN